MNELWSFITDYERCDRIRKGTPKRGDFGDAESCAQDGYGPLQWAELERKYRPAIYLMNRVQACILADICDARFSKLFFCPYHKNLKEVFPDTPPYQVFNDDFLRALQAFRRSSGKRSCINVSGL
jgi:hypothetical protein